MDTSSPRLSEADGHALREAGRVAETGRSEPGPRYSSSSGAASYATPATADSDESSPPWPV